ncbi:MAG: 50S ribosomal protein L11 methyltransferase [Candidatus Limisoma sp.]|nr:50S ribosomal protein L11 methyltransferase [Bacteroidales bacterium]MDY5893523.1 50S ribosomal protein L11 methyltransferase [Candidatus Limisoma sp.]
MNDYYKVKFTLAPCLAYECDILAALLADVGFESFEQTDDGVDAFVKKELWDKDAVSEVIKLYDFEAKIDFSEELVVGQDWNEEWEKHYFNPIVFEDKCVIHSSFHKDFPRLQYDIVIDPKMAFGTGHHETTSLMIKRILDAEMTGKSVLDMGTGTGVLAILSAMVGATNVVGVEIDPPAYENAVANAQLNGHPEIDLRLGGAEMVTESNSFDFVLANINRNIITADIDRYASALKAGGEMMLSGFYVDDVPVVEAAANKCGLERVSVIEKNRWANLQLVKK